MVIDRFPSAHRETSGSDLTAPLKAQGIEAVIVAEEADLESVSSDRPPQMAIVDLSSLREPDLRRCVRRCSELRLPVIALVPGEQVAALEATLGVDDFIVYPFSSSELVARAKRAIWRTRLPEGSELIRAGDLVINPMRYEVSVSGKRVDLRFKEYELLRLLATSPGRVYSREALLNRVWGYDFFGGTRTVDVHIRRLRSKIEDADHAFIETIWNVGYRFKDFGGRPDP